MDIRNYKKVLYSVVLVILFIAIFGAGIWVGVTRIAYHVPQPGTIDFSLFWDAYSKLEQKFVDPSKITDQEIIYGAIAGMTNSLGDPYTDFFNPKQAGEFYQNLSGSFEGIGAEIGIKDGLLTIIAPLKDAPSQKAGLKSGDTILKIDDKDATGMTTTEAVGLIRGAKGTSVTLNIMREDWTSSKDIKIIRSTIQLPAMEWTLKENGVAHIQIYQFNDVLNLEFEKASLEILQSGAKKIVLDLRDNPGGYLGVAQDIAGWFLQKGQVVTIEDFGKDEDPQIYKAEGNSVFADFPVVVLINQGSASASEILAGAIRDNRGAQLVGEKSFGKGSVQEVVDLRGGSFLKITIARWLTPKGDSISEVGLTPDIKVELTEDDFKEQRDAQLERALEIINNLK